VRSLVHCIPVTVGNINTIKIVCTVSGFRKTEWWATLESNQACVSARELQSPATPCGLSPTAKVHCTRREGVITSEPEGRQPKIPLFSHPGKRSCVRGLTP
jgi:hypothetical protein